VVIAKGDTGVVIVRFGLCVAMVVACSCADRGQFDLYLAQMDPSTGMAVGTIAPLPGSQPGIWRMVPAWSPDGTQLIYRMTGNVTSKDWIVRTMATGAERRYAVNLEDARNPAWHPDGRSIVIRGVDATERPGFYRLGLETGSLEYMWRGWRLLYGPSGRDAIFSVGDLWRNHDFSTGTESDISMQGPGAAYARSHDGRFLAVLDGSGNTVAVVPTDGTPRRTIAADIPDLQTTNFEFSPDDRFVYVVSGANVSTVWQVPVNGGQPQSTGLTATSIHDMSLSPDGRTLVFAVWTSK
jgi:Tol biopolymer transport system component